MSELAGADPLPGTDEALRQLDALEAADTAAEKQRDEQGQVTAGKRVHDEQAQRAAPDSGENAQNPDPKPKTDTPATAETKPEVTNPEVTNPEGKDEAGKSRFAKSQERLQGGWKELNESKAQLKAEREAIQRERAQLEAHRQQFESEQAEPTADDYEAAAKKFEEDGKFDFAEMAQRKAEELRKHPPLKRSEKLAAARKEWTLKAGVDFPDLAKAGSPTQQRVAQLLKDEPDLDAHPKGIYVAARIADLETQLEQHKTAAARVADLEKEKGQLETKVKELEALTAPGGAGSAQHLPGEKSFNEMTPDEQWAQLQRDARDLGSIR